MENNREKRGAVREGLCSVRFDARFIRSTIFRALTLIPSHYGTSGLFLRLYAASPARINGSTRSIAGAGRPRPRIRDSLSFKVWFPFRATYVLSIEP